MYPLKMRYGNFAHAAPVTSVSLDPHSSLLATASYDGTVLVWDISTPSSPVVLSKLSHRRLVNSASWNHYRKGILATASADKTVAIWDISDPASPQLVTVLGRHTDDINSVAWMPDGNRLVCVSEDGRATLWNATTSTFEGAIASHAAHCMMVDISAQGLVATVGEDGLVAVKDPDTGEARERRYDGSVEGCAWSHDGRKLAVTRDDGNVDVLSNELDLLVGVAVASSAARSVSWSDDDKLLVVGAYDGAIHLVSADGEKIASATDARFWPRSVSTSGSIIAVGSFWSAPHLLDVSTLKSIFQPMEATHGVNAVAFSDGEVLLGDDSGLVIKVPHDASLSLLQKTARSVQATASPILSLAAASGSAWAGTYSGHIVPAGEGEMTSANIGAPVPSLVSLGDNLIAGTYNGELVEIDKKSLGILRRREAYNGSIKSLAMVPGTDTFVSASTDRTVSIGTFEERHVLWEHGNLVNMVAVNSHGSVVASASRDHMVKVGRLLPDGTVNGPVLSLLGADESVKAVAVLGNAEAPIVIGGSYDFGLYVWYVDWNDHGARLRTGEARIILGQGVSTIVATDDKSAVAVGWDGSLVFLEVEGGKILEVANHAISDLLNLDKKLEGSAA